MLIPPLIVAGIGVAGAAHGYLAVMWHGAWALPAAAMLALAALGTWDLVQPRHTILRLYPIPGHVR
ncbi:MAG: FMN-binding glutamate synthase family protein, partial [Mycobacterium sp.]